MRFPLVAGLVTLGVWGACRAGASFWQTHVSPRSFVVLAVIGVAIGAAVLVSTRSVVRAVALGVLTVVLPAFEIALLYPNFLYE